MSHTLLWCAKYVQGVFKIFIVNCLLRDYWITCNHHSTSLHHTLTHSATYDVQDVEIHGGSENISIQCVFASGSQARGCHVEIRNSSIKINITRSSSLQSQTAEQTVTGLAPGSYEVLIFDWERDGSVSSTPSYVGHVNVTALDTSTTSVPPTTTTSRIVVIETNSVPHGRSKWSGWSGFGLITFSQTKFTCVKL